MRTSDTLGPILLALALAAPAPAQQAPHLIVIEPSGGSALATTGCSDVSDWGVVVGLTIVGGVRMHFEWTAAGGFHYPIHLPSGGGRRLNNWGDSIVPGTNGTTDLVLADGTHVPIPDPLNTTSPVGNRDLNDQLYLIGQGVPTNTTSSLFWWNPSQGSQIVPIPNGKTFNRLNSGSLAVGHIVIQATRTEGFRYDLQTGALVNLSSLLPAGGSSDALDVNDHGVVVGVGPDGTARSAFVWDPQAGFTFLPGLKGGPTQYVRPRAIDNRGRVVGSALTGAGENRAFLWDPSTGMTDLNDLVPPGTFLLAEAEDISETEVIVGWGFHGPVWGPDRGFILNLREPFHTYCTAKVNSCGRKPAISAAGSPSAAATSGFTVQATGARAGRLGILMYSPGGPAELPFLGGTLCVSPQGRKRGAAVISVGGTGGATCNAVFSIDWAAFAAGALGGTPAPFLRSPGQRVDVQWWGRDTVQGGAFLSNGLEYTVGW